MTRTELTIEGMSCNHCVMSLKNTLNTSEHITVEDVQIGTARIQYDETNMTIKQLEQMVEEAGFTLVTA